MQNRLGPFVYLINKIDESKTDFIDRACLLWNILHYIILGYQKKYPHWLFIRHESIADAPTAWFDKIFNYLELSIDENVAHYIEKYTSSDNLADSNSTSYQPRNSKMCLDTWRSRLTAEEIERVDSNTKNIASNFYEDYA
jgi:hypothetical protein